ncbi:diaminobutyrate acetyltransferase [Alkalicoccobacillus murimartini]|jgi:L-2,4-diaminobutyric acid acetyltransferase|uniref:L-2,4-diaminobutyric acid acetyltransferase n=1 Tax=Alkalicoccobacillus murimartini TaxID=171685 RepID=A0ABT9YK85_9BACI|nr:diaminobutyrate acetyltransferase [Alkalicoccobacillus murimartini]MDQ0208270.1 L-2,4-diaminobutyric acid acetyltransferase [Alkalicoccobacillus murimartini]
MSKQTATIVPVTFEKPKKEDSSAMWNLVNESTLDQNSPYKYMMMADFFTDTCVVAKQDDELVGFVTAFIQPERPDTLFIWQVGVDASQRGKGLASKMITELITWNAKDIKYLEATVTPSNQASRALFNKLGRELDTECEISDHFSASLFPDDSHEKEQMFRVGPFKI